MFRILICCIFFWLHFYQHNWLKYILGTLNCIVRLNYTFNFFNRWNFKQLIIFAHARTWLCYCFALKPTLIHCLTRLKSRLKGWWNRWILIGTGILLRPLHGTIAALSISYIIALFKVNIIHLLLLFSYDFQTSII